MNFRCERRVYADAAAYLVWCAGREETMSLEDFAEKAKTLAPTFNERDLTLNASGYSLRYVPGRDDTQYLS